MKEAKHATGDDGKMMWEDQKAREVKGVGREKSEWSFEKKGHDEFGHTKEARCAQLGEGFAFATLFLGLWKAKETYRNLSSSGPVQVKQWTQSFTMISPGRFQSMDYLGYLVWIFGQWNHFEFLQFWWEMGCSYAKSMCRQCPFTQSVDEGCLASLVSHSAGRKMWAGGPKIQNYNSNLFGSMSSIHGARKNLMHDMKQGRAWSLVVAAADTEAIEENYCSVHADFKKSIEVLALVNQIWLLMSVSQTSWHNMLPPKSYFSWSYLGEIIINKTLATAWLGIRGCLSDRKSSRCLTKHALCPCGIPSHWMTTKSLR